MYKTADKIPKHDPHYKLDSIIKNKEKDNNNIFCVFMTAA